MNKEYKIYTLKDPNTGDIKYVGVTTSTLKGRLNQHIYESRNKKLTHKRNWVNSLLKLGLKPIIETIEICTDDNWEERERYWISYYGGLYNITNHHPGGKGVNVGNTGSNDKKKVAVCQYDLQGNFIKMFNSLTEAAKEVKSYVSSISSSVDDSSRSVKGFQWRSYQVDNIDPYSKHYWGQAVVVYKMVPVLYKEYSTMREASKDLNIDYDRIYRSINGGKVVEGFLIKQS